MINTKYFAFISFLFNVHKVSLGVLKLSAVETEMLVAEIDTRTEEPEAILNLRKALIKLLLDPEIRAQLYETIKTEHALRENRAKTYR